MSLELVDGGQLTGAESASFDVVVVGSGPGGATVARAVARGGASVAVVEEGALHPPGRLPEDSFTAMARLYRDMGASVTRSPSPVPYVQGRAVGGTSVINGAISWRLPQDVHAGWGSEDPELQELLPWERVCQALDTVEADLNIHPTDPAVAGPNNLLLAEGAAALGLEHRPIRRNVRGCVGSGRCLQGCPHGAKASMDGTYLPDACAAGARIYARTRIDGIRLAERRDRATGVTGVTAGGGRLTLSARRAVVLAASAVQTPALLWRSGVRSGPVGQGFQCHPGASMAGRFAQPVRVWRGATQGHEVTGLRQEGLKFEALGYDMAMVAARQKGVGAELSERIEDLAHWCNWGVAVRSEARGRVRPAGPREAVRWTPTEGDMRQVRKGVRVLGEMMLAAGAQYVTPGVFGWHAQVEDPSVMASFDEEGPLDPRAYALAVTHMFGTCRMASDPARGVVRPDFRHHQVDGLYIADSSVFPSNTGVNPQTSIIALASLCGEHVLG